MCIKSFISSDSFLSFFLARKSRVFSLFRTGFVWRPNHFDEFYSRIIFLDTFSCGTPAKTQTNTRAPTKQIKMLYFNLSLMWSRENGSGFLLFSLPFFVIVWKIISAKAFRSHQPTKQQKEFNFNYVQQGFHCLAVAMAFLFPFSFSFAVIVFNGVYKLSILTATARIPIYTSN